MMYGNDMPILKRREGRPFGGLLKFQRHFNGFLLNLINTHCILTAACQPPFLLSSMPSYCFHASFHGSIFVSTLSTTRFLPCLLASLPTCFPVYLFPCLLPAFIQQPKSQSAYRWVLNVLIFIISSIVTLPKEIFYPY